jgi:putative flippase GtrA
MSDTMRALQRTIVRIVAFFFFDDPRLFFRYIAVGGASAVIEYTVFNVLYSIAGLATLSANSIAIVIAVVFHFNLQKRWTFRDSQSLRRQLPRYLLMIGLAAVLNNLLVYLFINVMLMPPALAKLLQIGVLFGLQFTASRLIVFSRHAG